jgi:hypothetical protein
VRADENLPAFLELERVTRESSLAVVITDWEGMSSCGASRD